MSSKKITYHDLGLDALIQYYEAKPDARSKMTADYLKEHMVISRIQLDNARSRLVEMRKHPTRQHLEWLAQRKKERKANEINIIND